MKTVKTPKDVIRGGEYADSQGYVIAYCPNHPRSRKGTIRLHRFIMELHLGRFLTGKEVIHHKDGNRKNNRIDNLELLPNGAAHNEQRHRPAPGEKCAKCGSPKVNRVFRKHGQPPLCYPCRFPKRRCSVCGSWPTIKGLCKKHYHWTTTRIKCNYCGKIIGKSGRNVQPPRCWRCTFPKRKCRICGGKHEAFGLCDNHYKQMKRGTLKD